MRGCVGCGREDDGPRHSTVLPDGTVMHWHRECHANNGCTVCQVQTAELTE